MALRTARVAALPILRPSPFTPALLRGSTTHTCLSLPTSRTSAHQQQARSFLPDLSQISPGPQTLTARRVFPYSAYPIFSIVADIGAYPAFLPLLTDAHVTKQSQPDAHYERRWPQEASLTVGMREITETFTSRVTCKPPVPGSSDPGVVEAVSGQEMAAEGSDSAAAISSGPLSLLRTRWEICPAAGSSSTSEQTDVALSIEYKFKSPIYEVMSRAAMPKVAESVISAFEKRVGQLLGDEERIPPPSAASRNLRRGI